MEALRWIAAVPCLTLGAYLAGMNAWILLLWALRRLPKGRSVSMVPLVGGGLMVLGLGLLPVPGVFAWWWVLLALDVSWVQLLVLPVFLLARFLRRREDGRP